MEEKIRRKILKKFQDKLVVKRSELVELIKDDVSKNPGDPIKVVDSVLRTFVQQRMITPLYASKSTFAITKTGVTK